MESVQDEGGSAATPVLLTALDHDFDGFTATVGLDS